MNLIHGDCLDVLPTLAPQSVDAVICDIPSGRTACAWDVVIPFEPMWANLKRIMKPRGAVVLLGCTQPFTSMLVMSNLKWFRHHWIYEKTKATNYVKAQSMPMRYHEDICVFASGGTIYNPQMQPGEPYRKTTRSNNRAGSYLKDTRPENYEYGSDVRYPSSIIRAHNQFGGEQFHPTQKPVALMEYLIRTYTNEGDTVLDFCAGSGSTGVACVNTGRGFIGIEKDADYFKIAERRISDAQAAMVQLEMVA